MKRKLVAVLVIAAAAAAWPQGAEACTGITLKAKDGAYVVARTIEWGGSNLNSRYVVVPRGYSQHSYTPQGTDGMEFTARYGYVGMAVEQEEFVAEGLNEAGLSAGLFYFPGYGRYEAFDASKKSSSIADLQLVPWILGSCATVEEVKAGGKGACGRCLSRRFDRTLALCGRFGPPTGAGDNRRRTDIL